MQFNGQQIKTVRIRFQDLKRFRRLAESSHLHPDCPISALIEAGLREHDVPLVLTGPGGAYAKGWPQAK